MVEKDLSMGEARGRLRDSNPTVKEDMDLALNRVALIALA